MCVGFTRHNHEATGPASHKPPPPLQSQLLCRVLALSIDVVCCVGVSWHSLFVCDASCVKPATIHGRRVLLGSLSRFAGHQLWGRSHRASSQLQLLGTRRFLRFLSRNQLCSQQALAARFEQPQQQQQQQAEVRDAEPMTTVNVEEAFPNQDAAVMDTPPQAQEGGAQASSASAPETDDMAKSYPLERNGRFHNPFDTFDMKEHSRFGRLFKLLFDVMTKDESNIPSAAVLDETLPVRTPDMEVLRSPPTDRMHVTWCGHAAILVQMQGQSILFDPVFSERCSPSSYFGPKRYRPTPLRLEELPRIDMCCVSHDHYDHMDRESIRTLHRLNPHMRWFVPLRCDDVLRDAGVPASSITQLTWWQESTVTLPNDNGDMTFVLTPAQHWGRRNTFDMFKRLWGSWCVIGKDQRFYFTGDTGYCRAFKEIGHHYGPFDVAAIPIGAYAPRWFMKPHHINPEEAVQLHKDLRAVKSFGIHWGTFKLTIENYLEPREELEAQTKAAGLAPDEFTTMEHGETRAYFPLKPTPKEDEQVIVV
ncbi:hypothetical protein PTSG_12980 [Salpingoeca rosetta]|uniref:Metallo-beta-lactamase domain-containing protein n=1 Tax=Salpingoeca rosetta (strain ATCC 50818 / BSB-021) TaxID=946362 RepID=F2UPC4_SALR5|nr:uncharacterized protein PTSG_12980 [Salpingoeca rosetta]EGD79479.1 hypothetical protein PTSG_12980 [Salpingoeca rosetta]|eukprot:XP_004988960.1 hypothetical protein PTSG_12980 [Salpingoeca rosetta]